MNFYDQIKDLIYEGLTAQKIEQKLGISRTLLIKILEEKKTNFRELKSQVKKELVLSLIEQGFSGKQIIENQLVLNIDQSFWNSIPTEEKKHSKEKFEQDLLSRIVHEFGDISLEEAAIKLNISKIKLQNIAKKKGHKFKHSSRKQELEKREIEYIALKNEGWTLQEIGNRDGITRERVRQIIKRGNEIKGGLKPLEDIRIEKDQKRIQALFNKFFTKFKDLYLKNYKQQYIADELGLTHRDILKIKELGFEKGMIPRYRPRHRKKISDRKRLLFEEVLKLREEGISIRKIASELGVSQPTISNYIAEMKSEGIYVSSGKVDGWVKPNTPVIEARIKYIIKSINEGKKIKEIAEDLAIGQGTLSRFMTKHKIHEKF